MSSGLVLPASLSVRRSPVETCALCRWSYREGDGDLVCRRHPPHASVLMVPAPAPRIGGFMPQPFSTFPIVRDDMFCGEFETK